MDLKDRKFDMFKSKEFTRDAYKNVLETEVVSCTKDNDGNYELVFDETIFYPHMAGGQPMEGGYINGIEVLNVFERGHEIIHVVSEELRGMISMEINIEKRLDHMQQHTGQHILTCAFGNLYGAKTIGFHLSEEYSTIDLDIAGFSEEMVRAVEEYANDIVFSNVEVEVNLYTYEEAVSLGLRKLLVDDEVIRTVKISDKDNVACCGTHLKTTSEVGMIKVLNITKYKGGTRVEFVCGKRAQRDYFNKNRYIYKLANEFSCHTTLVAENVLKLKNDYANLVKKAAMFQNELLKYECDDLANNGIEIDGIKHVFLLAENRDAKEVKLLVSKIVEKPNFICACIIKNEEECHLLLAQSKEVDSDLKTLFAKCTELLKVKGGGSNLLIQGMSKERDKAKDCFELMKNYFVS